MLLLKTKLKKGFTWASSPSIFISQPKMTPSVQSNPADLTVSLTVFSGRCTLTPRPVSRWTQIDLIARYVERMLTAGAAAA